MGYGGLNAYDVWDAMKAYKRLIRVYDPALTLTASECMTMQNCPMLAADTTKLTKLFK